MFALKTAYKNEIKPKLAEELGIKNPMLLPKLEKIVIPKNVNKIFENAFFNCSNLQEVIILSDDIMNSPW